MHTCFSPDSGMKPEKLVSRCVEMGIDCIAITDHNTIDGALAVQSTASIRVIVGEEIKSRGGEITGLFLQETIPSELSPLETVQRIKGQGGLVSIPHPFDHFRRSVINPKALQQILSYVDIIEAFNARNTFQRDNETALALALQHDILISSVSDSHTSLEVGRSYVETPDFDHRPLALMEALSRGRLVRRPITPLIHLVTTLTKIRKHLIG